MKICIDPGHYGSDYNPGVAAGYVESNFTWTYAHLMKARLERYGVEVIFTRNSKDENPGLQARGKMSEGCDLFISVHSNASENPNRNAIFCHWSMVSGGEDIAKAIGEALTTFLKGEWGSIQKQECYYVESEKHPGQDYYGVLLGASKVGTPAVIVEHSFHTNPKYCEWAMGDGNIERMCDVEVDTIASYYGLEVVSNSPYFIPLNKPLKKGDKGEDVKRMQMRFRQIDASFDREVAAHSFNNGVPDGSFGSKMVDTVKRFQNEVGLEATGELNLATIDVLNTTIIEYNKNKTELVDLYNNTLKKWSENVATLEEDNMEMRSVIELVASATADILNK